MADVRLVNYVKEQLKAGFSEATIKDALMRGGYSEHEALDAISEAVSPERVKMIPPPMRAEEKITKVEGFQAFVGILKKNWIIFLAIAIVAAGGIVGAFVFIGGGNIGFGKNCGEDSQCLAEAFSSCTRATGTYETGSTAGSVTLEGAIEGKKGSDCVFSVRAKSATGTLSSYKGTSMSCEVPLEVTGNVASPLRDLSSIKPSCTGPLSSLIS